MIGEPGASGLDALIEQLRVRAADPEGRTEFRPSVFEAGVAAMSLGGLFSFGRSIAESLRSVVESNQSGRMPDGDVLRTARGIEHDMTTPAPADDLRRASPEELRAAEAALGIALPPLLARLYIEVGDGGFGPGRGLLSLQELVRDTRALRKGDVLPRNRSWPVATLPLVQRDPGWSCLDTSTGAILEWDPEDLEERTSEERFRRSFTQVSPSLEAWLAKWLRRMEAAVRKPSQEQRWARMVQHAQSPEGIAVQERKTRRYLAQMSPEDRKKWGFDELYPDIGQPEKPGDLQEPRAE